MHIWKSSVFLLFLMIAVQGGYAQPGENCTACHSVEVGRGENIPHDYNTYSLFLVPSAEFKWKGEQVEQLRKVFKAFGDDIGEDNAAIWLASEQEPGIDILRSKEYCDLFGIGYNGGPYVVFTRRHPDADGRNEAVIISLDGISFERTIRLLNLLQEDIRRERDARKGRLYFEGLRQKLFSFVGRNYDEIKSVIFTIFNKGEE